MIFEKFDNPNNQANLLSVAILNRVRFVAIIGQIVLIFFAIHYLDIHLPVQWLVCILGVEVIVQIYSTQKVKHSDHVSSIELFSHILADSMVLSALIYFTGGANNPFIYLLLLSIALGTLMLTPRYLVLVTMVQFLLYSLLNIYQRPLELGDSSPLASFHLHLTGMWVNFGLTAILIAIFGFLARHTMIKQEKQIQQLREKQLKDEQILSLGIMSASAAHELGTPLATMAIVVDDLFHQEDESSQIHQDMTLLASQIDNCRNIIKALNEKSGHSKKQLLKQQDQTGSKTGENLKKRLQSVFENWLVYRPQIKLLKHWGNNFEKINYELPISVEQAVTNLLDNSADASLDNQCDQVEICCDLKSVSGQQQLIIDITDFGTGLTPEVRASLGASIQETNKTNGLGWGLFLSNASIERMGGEVHMLESDSGGTLTRVSMPLERQQ